MRAKSTFCVLPWLQISSKANGSVRTCGYARVKTGNQPNLKDQEISAAWNSEYYRDIRKSMLAGESPANCAKCLYREAHEGTSRRQKENLAWQNELTEEKARSLTAHDGSLNQPPILLDIRTGNVCNLKCVTCFPTNSTKWLEDKDLLGKYENTQLAAVTPAWDQPDGPAWRFVREYGKALKIVNFLGGEPLASPLHQSILDSLIDQRAFQVSLKYVSNGTLIKPELLDQWSRFHSVQLMVSLDGVGSVLEFIRFPAKWGKLKENLLLLQTRGPTNLKLQFLWTCSNLSFYYLPETIAAVERDFPSFELILGDHVSKPAHLSPKNLPLELKTVIESRLVSSRYAERYAQIQFYLNNMKSEDLWPSQGPTLTQYLDDLNRVRGTHWRSTFPELSPFL